MNIIRSHDQSAKHPPQTMIVDQTLGGKKTFFGLSKYFNLNVINVYGHGLTYKIPIKSFNITLNPYKLKP
jgi:hypothetical protein